MQRISWRVDTRIRKKKPIIENYKMFIKLMIQRYHGGSGKGCTEKLTFRQLLMSFKGNIIPDNHKVEI